MNREDWIVDNDTNTAHYEALLSEYGAGDVRTADWASRESQERRFAVLCEGLDLSGSKVLDVGCGTGDLLEWLAGRGFNVDYTGIDIAPRVILAARDRFADGSFEICNLLDCNMPESSYDYVISSGIFTFRQAEPMEFMKAMVSRMFDVCRRSVTVNALSMRTQEREAGEWHCDPDEALAFCRTLSSRAFLREDYHPRDFTIRICREDAE